jgi:hypothetical protein
MGIISWTKDTAPLVAHLRTAIAGFDRQIKATYESHPDRFLTASLPGAGPALEPRLIAALGSERERFRTWPVVSAWRRSLKAAGTPAGCTGVGAVPNSSGKPFMNGRVARFGPASGHGNTMIGSATKATAIMPPFDPLPTNGSASSSAAGKTAALLRTTVYGSTSQSCHCPIHAGGDRLRADAPAFPY